MEKMHRSQLAKMFLLLSFLFLLLLIPFISASLKSSYLYLILNLLIIVLGVEAGAMSKPRVDEKKQVSASVATAPTNESVRIEYEILQKTVPAPAGNLQVRKKMCDVVEKVQKLKRCPTRPSLFFIGSYDDEEEEKEVAVAKEEKVAVREEMGEISKQELFLKAEMFIGDFYKQLKMQREKSWKKIHGLYDRAF